MKDLTEILAVTGKGGLFKLVAKTSNSIIVESLADGKRFPVYAAESVSSLEEISVFTLGEDMPLKEVFQRFLKQLNRGKAPSHKAPPAELKKLMEEAVPEYDADRVYTSDIKKIVKWYNALLDANMMDALEEEKTQDEEKTKDGKKAQEEEKTQGEKKAQGEEKAQDEEKDLGEENKGETGPAKDSE